MKKTEVGGVSSSCQMGEIAAIICADEVEGFSGAELLDRAIVCSANETGLPGRVSA